ncbi:hypothetical protein D9M70_562100 [compost metagenome]
MEIAAPQHLGEQPQLAAGARTLALDTTRRQRGFAADGGNERLVQRVQLCGNGVEEFGSALGGKRAEGRIGRLGGAGGGVHLGFGGLVEGAG